MSFTVSDSLRVSDISDSPIRYAECLFKLIKRVYQSSDTFCDSFSEIYPSFDSFKNKIHDQKSTDLYLCAFSEQRVIGYLILSPQKPSKLRHTAFFTMGIDPDFRGLGVGKLLMQSMLDLRPTTTEIIYLMVRTDNTAAIKLYEKFNFSPVATLKNDTKIGAQYFDGQLMSRSFIF